MKIIYTISNFAFLIVLLLLSSCNKKDSSPIVENSSYDGSVSQVKDYLNKNLKDPESYESIEWGAVKKTNDGYKVSHKYRAKNSFGALVIENTVFYLNSVGNVVKTVKFEEDILETEKVNKNKWQEGFKNKFLKDSLISNIKISNNVLTITINNINSGYKKITEEIAKDFWSTYREIEPYEVKSITVVYYKGQLIKEIRVSDRGVILNEDM